MKGLERILLVMAVSACFVTASWARDINKYNWMWEEPESWDVCSHVVSPSGNYVISGTHNAGSQLRPDFGPGIWVNCFDRTSNMPLFAFEIDELRETIFAVACSYDAEYIAFPAADQLYLLDREGNELWRSQIAPCMQESVCVSLDGNYVAVANYVGLDGADGAKVFYYSVTSNEPLWTFKMCNDDCTTQGIKISDDGRYVAALVHGRDSRGPILFFFDTTSATPDEPVWQFIGEGWPSNWANLEMTPDGSRIVLQANEALAFFDNSVPSSGDKQPLWINTCGGYPSIVHDTALSDDGLWLAHGGPYLDNGHQHVEGVVELWSTADLGTLMWSYEIKSDTPSVAITADGSKIFFGGQYELIFTPLIGVLNAEGTLLWTYEVPGVVSCDAEGLYMAAARGVMRGYNIREYEPMYLFADVLNQEPVITITSPQADETVISPVVVTGTASDPDGSLSSVVAGFNGFYLPATDTSELGDWSEWSIELDLSGLPAGEVILQAESVDDLYKYSYPAEVSVTLLIPTATPIPPTITPSPQPETPTITPTPEADVIFELSINGSFFGANELLSLVATTQSFIPNTVTELNQIIALDVYGALYFNPDWTLDLDYEVLYLYPYIVYRDQVLNVVMPSELTPAGPFYFLGAIFDHESWELIGSVVAVPFFLM